VSRSPGWQSYVWPESGSAWAGRLNGLPGLDVRRDTRDVSGKGFPQDLIVNAVIDMRDENPVRADVVPRHRRYGRFDVVGEIGGTVADPADRCRAGNLADYPAGLTEKDLQKIPAYRAYVPTGRGTSIATELSPIGEMPSLGPWSKSSRV
jgi:hypothetical protein